MTTINHAVAAVFRGAVRQAQSFEPGPDRRPARAVAFAAAVTALGLSSFAAAQQAPAAGATGPAAPAAAPGHGPVTLEEVTVTGSRIKRTTDFNTPTPTTVIDTSTMESMGVVSVGAAATLAPANVATFTPADTGNSNFFTGEYIADLRGLNPYFGSRTLLLINGQRVVNSTQGDSFDMNLIPTILVSRIDTVTGGASAAYGSGAIAGVENVIINTQLEGGKIQGDWYETSHSDGKDRHIGAAFGHGFLDNRFHFVIGGEYENSDGVACQSRSWCQQGEGEYQLGNTPPASGGAGIIGYGYNIRNNFSNYPGVLFGLSNFGGYQGGPPPVTFTPDGTHTAPYALGTPQVSFADSVQGGDGTSVYQFSELTAPVNRGTGMASLNGKITDWLNFNTTYLLAREVTTTYSGAVGTLAGSIYPQNAFACPGTPNGPAYGPPGAGPTCVNASSPDVAAAVGGGAFLNKDWSAQIPALTRFTTNVSRFTFGFNGAIGDSSWTWDAHYEYGLTHHDQLVQDNYSLYRINMALDSVIGPNGQPECRVTADGFAGAVAATTLTAGPGGPVIVASPYANANPALAQGCVPVNPFGTQPLSSAALGYAWGNLLEQLRYQQTDANINFSGNYFRGIGAGPFALAVGYEWRQEGGDNIDQPGQPAYLADDFETQYGSSFGGQMTVNEEYVETNIPLLKNEPGAHLLEFDLAARNSQYSNSPLYGVDVCSTPGVNGCPLANAPPGSTFNHSFVTWKVSGIYEPVDWLRFRGTQSRDERAPNFRELYYNQVIGAGGLFGQCGPFGTTFDPCTWNLLGNPNLKPESSDTTTLGIILTPKELLPGFQFSADWFHIKINNAIEQANPILLETQCKQNPTPGGCAALTFNNNPLTAAGAPCPFTGTPQQIYAAGCYNLSSIAPTSYNGAFYEVRGIDFSLNYLADLGRFGTISTRLLTTWMDQQVFQSYPGGPVLSILGQTGTGNGFLNDYTPTARWRGSLMVTWAKGPISITPNMSFVSRGTMDYLGVTPADGAVYTQALNGTLPPNLAAAGVHPMPVNYVPSYFLFGLNGTYSFDEVPALQGLQLFVQINNLFNKTPPFTGGENLFGPANIYGGTNPIFFDTMGLAWRAGFRLNF